MSLVDSTRPDVEPVNRAGRVLGIDLARFLAIAGMMAAYLIVPRSDLEPYTSSWLTVLTSGLPSALFAVIGGFGIYLASRRYLAQGQRGAAAAALLARGAVVMLIGLVLELLPDHPIAVILIFFGAAIACCAPLVLLPTWALAAIAVCLPFLGTTAGYELSHLYPARTIFAATSSTEALSALFLTGFYPVITWTTYLLIGLIAARYLLGGKRPTSPGNRALVVAALGAGALIVGKLASSLVLPSALEYLRQRYALTAEQARYVIATYHRGVPLVPPPLSFALAAPHSGSPADVLVSSGVALGVTGLLVAMTWHMTSTPRFLAPFAWTGAVPLTVYSLHIVLTAATWSATNGGDTSGAGLWWYQSEFWGQVIVVLVVGTGIGLAGKKGPLEALVSAAARQAGRRVADGGGVR